MSFVIIGGSDRTAGPIRVDGRLVRGVSLVSAGGSVDLLAAPYRLTNPTSGLTGPDSPLDTRTAPGRDGGYLVGAALDQAGQTVDVARPTLTVRVDAGSAEATAVAVDRLRNVLRARLWGPAELTVSLPARARRLTVRHEPAAGDFDTVRGGGRVRFVTVRLTAHSPFWRGDPGKAGPWGLDSGVGPMLPYLPRRVGSSTIIGQANAVTVAGNQVTPPTVTVVGPLAGGSASTTVELTRDGVTRGYTVAQELGAGETLTVRHDPDAGLGGRQVEGPGGASWAQYLDDDHDLFLLRPGVQRVRVVLSGALPGASAGLTWPTLYESALD